jgi:hypothetical protein
LQDKLTGETRAHCQQPGNSLDATELAAGLALSTISSARARGRLTPKDNLLMRTSEMIQEQEWVFDLLDYLQKLQEGSCSNLAVKFTPSFLELQGLAMKELVKVTTGRVTLEHLMTTLHLGLANIVPEKWAEFAASVQVLMYEDPLADTVTVQVFIVHLLIRVRATPPHPLRF